MANVQMRECANAWRMCKCVNVQMCKCLNAFTNAASKGANLHICTFTHLHINHTFAH